MYTCASESNSEPCANAREESNYPLPKSKSTRAVDKVLQLHINMLAGQRHESLLGKLQAK